MYHMFSDFISLLTWLKPKWCSNFFIKYTNTNTKMQWTLVHQISAHLEVGKHIRLSIPVDGLTDWWLFEDLRLKIKLFKNKLNESITYWQKNQRFVEDLWFWHSQRMSEVLSLRALISLEGLQNLNTNRQMLRMHCKAAINCIRIY